MSDTFLQNDTWKRRHAHGAATISRKLYMLLVCTWTGIGVAFSAATSFISQDWKIKEWGTWPAIGFYVGVLAVAILGTFIANASSKPIVSAFGYALVAGPFGLMLGPLVAQYTAASVVKVFVLTSMVVLVLGLVGVFIPDDLASWATPLFGALLFLIGAQFIVPLLGSLFGLPINSAMTLVDWIGIVIFGALVIFDLNRASRMPYTIDNAIDAAVAIYLDFINIFLRLLILMGDKKS